MKEAFNEYYTPDDVDYRGFIESGLVVLDANVLLAPYKVDSDTRSQFFSVLEELQDRIWVPYQAGWEFFQRRPGVLSGEDKVYANLQKPLDGAKANIEDHLKTLRRHPVVTEAEQAKLMQYIDNALALVKRLSDGRDEKLEEALRSDTILKRWERVLEGKLGTAPSAERTEEYEKEAQLRYAAEVPPGYLDRDKPENTYGDAILWLQLLEYLKAGDRPKSVLLITDDVKEDWYRRQSGRTIGPRVELVREMRNLGVKYYQQRLPAFLSRSSRVLHRKVSEEAIRRVSEAASGQEGAHVYEGAVLAALKEAVPGIIESGALRHSVTAAPDFVWKRRVNDIGIEVRSGRSMGFKEAAYLRALAESSRLPGLLAVSTHNLTPAAVRLLEDSFAQTGRIISHVRWHPEDPVEILTEALTVLAGRVSELRNQNWKNLR